MSEENKRSKTTNNVEIPAELANIKTVVVLMLENRSLDNLLGFLYPNGEQPKSVYPPGSSTNYNGASTNNSNAYKGKTYNVTNGTVPTATTSYLQQPDYDPREAFLDGNGGVAYQLYADDRGNLDKSALDDGSIWNNLPPMTGFAWDYDEFYTTNQAVMGSYNMAQLPIINGLAKSFGVSDRWFSSVPTQTFPNRAFSICGTSGGKLNNKEIDDTTYADTETIFNVLGNAGKTWGLYYSDTLLSRAASGVPPWDVFTQYIFPEINSAPGGSVQVYDDSKNPKAFLQSAAAGTLPNFCFVEPSWGGGPAALASIQGTDYHPVSNAGPCEAALNEIYEALVNSPQWDEMLFVITFDEHGGTYDHEPPTKTISPDGIIGDSNFGFNRLGVRVPTILISPFMPEGTVFRSPSYNSASAPQPDFDHTSLVATLMKWAGVDPTSALGKRVAVAPTFEGALSTTARTDKPKFTVPPGYAEALTNFDPFSEPPLDENGQPMEAKTMNVKDFRAICDEVKDKDELYRRLRKLRFGK